MIIFLKKAGHTCLFLFVLFLSIAKTSASECYLNADQSEAYKYILNLEFDKGITALKGRQIYNYQIKSLALCLDAFINCDKKKYQLGKRLSVKWLDSVNTFSEGPDKNFVKCQIKLHWAFLASSYGEKIGAALEIRQAYLLLKENYRKYPKHKPTLLYYGLLNSLIFEIPENYRWLSNAVGLNTAGRKGMDMIEISHNCHPLLDLERHALVLLRKPQSTVQQEQMQKSCDYLLQHFGEEELVRFIVSFSYLKNKNTGQASILVQGFRNKLPAMFVYQKALASYHLLDTDTAIHYFKKYNRLNRSEIFKKDSYLKLAYLYSLEGDSVQSALYKSNIKRTGNDAVYADKLAEKLASEATPGFLLLKARILFDAGNWPDARRFLLLTKPISASEKAEFCYRLGKIETELGDMMKAKTNYKECLQACPKSGVHYGPFACLNLSEIYIKEGNARLAGHYLSYSRKYSGFDYGSTYKTRYSILSNQIR